MQAVLRRRLGFLITASRADLWRSGVVVAVLGLAGFVFNSEFGLYVDFSEIRCLPERLYLGYPRAERLKKGSLVSFRSTSRDMLDLMTGKRVVKQVAAVAGDHVVSHSGGVFINGELVANRNPISLSNIARAGRTPVDVDRVLQEGELFLMGTLPRAFDSRYWGVISSSRIDRQFLGLI
jgi:conjugal transfer pilin signal peptidase TrbI